MFYRQMVEKTPAHSPPKRRSEEVKRKMTALYWVYNQTCDTTLESGYVGITEDPERRLYHLRSSGTVPRDAVMRVLLHSSRAACLRMEKRLRPHRNVGRNKQVGGTAPARLKHGHTPLNHEAFRDFWA
jgi:hypothetical protein